jgi:hypothetical protein
MAASLLGADYTPTDVVFLDAATYVAAGAALGSLMSFVFASVARDLGLYLDVTDWVQRGGGHGGLFGLVLYVLLR